VQNLFKKAKGSVLFIDEAYSLTQNKGNDFGAEAIATLIKAMEDKKDELVIIFAGYKKEMKEFVDVNPGMASRIGYTFDFKEFFQCENAFLPFNRNGVLFPEKINGKYAMLSRPSDNGHTPFGDIYISYSPDMKYWGEHRCVMKVTPFPVSAWQCTKIGAGSVPILTDEGWLLFYHGVITTCNGFRYSMGAALLDKNDPSKVLYRTQPYLLAPAAPYELAGDVPNVVFPCAALNDGDKVAVYYGAADTVVGMAFGYISEIIDFMKKNNCK
jgi:beta-1,4-mannooligosaccharide/beta-1,4-mannosyl-N-acetylglucosamine phosphorylase